MKVCAWPNVAKDKGSTIFNKQGLVQTTQLNVSIPIHLQRQMNLSLHHHLKFGFQPFPVHCRQIWLNMGWNSYSQWNEVWVSSLNALLLWAVVAILTLNGHLKWSICLPVRSELLVNDTQVVWRWEYFWQYSYSLATAVTHSDLGTLQRLWRGPGSRQG